MPAYPVESAIVIKVPEVEYAVGQHRQIHDPSERWGIPAHVTLLYPFLVPSEIDTNVLVRLKAILALHQVFEVQFLRTQWFGDEVLWLAPEPDSSFRLLTDSLVSAFPETSPYGGAILDPIPHLTVAHRADVNVMREVESQVVAVLPIRALLDSVSVMVGAPEIDSWTTIADIPLGKR